MVSSLNCSHQHIACSRVRLGMQPRLLALPCIRCLQQREVSACEPKKRKSSFAYRGVIFNISRDGQWSRKLKTS
ncbi:hypothetical protein ATANTOWER_008734 [Ataeniobius toweri]|uniref:Uncharacterized protein n=1 Tax=Ataeniobius toweri TaxID=208326 RepID=A0ABU7A149_9TELE|nr:hypothetical protein [Ataeniobius toweri]